jgi:hypothetical protein
VTAIVAGLLDAHGVRLVGRGGDGGVRLSAGRGRHWEPARPPDLQWITTRVPDSVKGGFAATAPLTVDAIVLAPTAIEGRVVWPLWRTPSWNQHDLIALHLKSPPSWTGFNISQTIRGWSSGCTDAGHSMACVTIPETLAEAPMDRRIVAISRTTAHRHGIKRPTTEAVSCETASNLFALKSSPRRCSLRSRV